MLSSSTLKKGAWSTVPALKKQKKQGGTRKPCANHGQKFHLPPLAWPTLKLFRVTLVPYKPVPAIHSLPSCKPHRNVNKLINFSSKLNYRRLLSCPLPPRIVLIGYAGCRSKFDAHFRSLRPHAFIWFFSFLQHWHWNLNKIMREIFGTNAEKSLLHNADCGGKKPKVIFRYPVRY